MFYRQYDDVNHTVTGVPHNLFLLFYLDCLIYYSAGWIFLLRDRPEIDVLPDRPEE